MLVFSFKYIRRFVADGNMTADHLRSASRVKDTWLGEGTGVIPRRDESKEWIGKRKSPKEVSRIAYFPIPVNIGSGHTLRAHHVPTVLWL